MMLSTRSLAAPEAWKCTSCRRRTLQPKQRRLHQASTIRRDQPSRGARTASKPGSTIGQAVSTSAPSQNALSRKPVLPDGPARTRFAPSPTGFLHIGGLRTALFSFLLAKRTGGQFLLRIEDTDQKRLVPGAEERLLEDLHWAGLTWDEGPQVGGPHGPYRQSERNSIYQQQADELLRSEAVYRCFCTPQQAGSGATAYVTSGCYLNCASLPAELAKDRALDKHVSFTVRLKRPTAVMKRGYPDLIYGTIVPLKRTLTSTPPEDSEAGAGIDAADTILIKSDGTPTYHFANVVDDHLMGITHVIRGSEWMASTPLHYDLYSACNWVPPKFAHVGLLVDENKAKLSKRNADLALDVGSMREQHGVLPETLVNFLALQGWSNPLRHDVMTLEQLTEVFDLKFTKGNTMVKFDKLWYLHKRHVARRCNEVRARGSTEAVVAVVEQVREVVLARYPTVRESLSTNEGLAEYCTNVLLADSKSYRNAEHFVERNRYFFEYNPEQVPSPPQQYGIIPATEIDSIVKFLFHAVDFSQTSAAPPATAPQAEGQMWFDHVSANIQEVLEQYLQVAAMTQSNSHALWANCTVSKADASADFDRWAAKDSLLNALNSPPPPSAAPREQGVHRLVKATSGAIMRYLRDKLGYGLPGPSISVVMALLGYKECCRRLGVEPRKDGGWDSLEVGRAKAGSV